MDVMQRLVARIEGGMCIGRDGMTCIAPTGEPYKTYVSALTGESDATYRLCERLFQKVQVAKRACPNGRLFWRMKPEIRDCQIMARLLISEKGFYLQS